MAKITLEVGLVGLFPTIAAFATETSIGHPMVATVTFGAGLVALVKSCRAGQRWPLHRFEIIAVDKVALADRTVAPLCVKALGGVIDDDGHPVWLGRLHGALGHGIWSLARFAIYLLIVAILGLLPMFLLSTIGALTGTMAGILIGQTLGGPIGTLLLGCLLAGRWTEITVENQAIAAAAATASTAPPAPAP